MGLRRQLGGAAPGRLAPPGRCKRHPQRLGGQGRALRAAGLRPRQLFLIFSDRPAAASLAAGAGSSDLFAVAASPAAAAADSATCRNRTSAASLFPPGVPISWLICELSCGNAGRGNIKGRPLSSPRRRISLPSSARLSQERTLSAEALRSRRVVPGPRPSSCGQWPPAAALLALLSPLTMPPPLVPGAATAGWPGIRG